MASAIVGTIARRIVVANLVNVVAMGVTIALVRQEERSLAGLLGICVVVFALAQLVMVVVYGHSARRLVHVFADQALLFIFALWVTMYGTYQALMQASQGTDPTSDITFGVLVLLFPLTAIATNLLLGAVAPRLLAAKK